MADARGRVWTWCVWPESAPEDWMHQLDLKHLSFAVSPLHDADVNGDETEKKKHWHVIIEFEGKKSYSQISELVAITHGSPPKVVGNPIGLVRYFIHLDNPEKAQYSRDDIQSFGGFDVDKPFKISSFQSMIIMVEIIKFCKAHDICYFQDLIDWLISEGKSDWLFVALCSNTIGINAYLKGHADKLRDMRDA